MTRWLVMFGLLGVLGVTGGCATAITRSGFCDDGVYRATELDARGLIYICTEEVKHDPSTVLLVPLVILDVPFSVFFDTILLPHDWSMVD